MSATRARSKEGELLGTEPGIADERPEEGIVSGQIGRHAAIYGLGLLLSKAVSFVMLPVYTRMLTPSDYGVMALIDMVLDVLSWVAGSQFALGIFRFYHKADSTAARRQVVSTALLGLGATYGVVGGLTLAAAGPLSELVFGDRRHEDVIRIAAAGLALQVLIIVPLTYARVRDLSRLFVTANLVKLVLNLGLNILFLVGLGMGVKGVFLSNVIGSVVVGGALTVWLVRSVGLQFSTAAARDLLRYGVPLMGMWLAHFIATFADRFFLEAAGDVATVGIYNLAYQFGFLLVYIAFTPFDNVWSPKRFQVAKATVPERDRMLGNAFVYINVLLFAGALGLTLFTEDMLRILTPYTYWSAAQLVPVILGAYVLQSWAAVQDIGILVTERTSYLALSNWMAAFVAIVGYAVMVPRWLGLGAAWATMIAFGVRWLLTYRISQRLWPVRYRWGPVLRIGGLALACGAGAQAMPMIGLAPSLAARAGLYLAFLVAAWRLGGLTEHERRTARAFVSRMWNAYRTRVRRAA